jgi:hypothetical protein
MSANGNVWVNAFRNPAPTSWPIEGLLTQDINSLLNSIKEISA